MKEEFTEKKDLERCFRQIKLSNVNVLGCILNAAKSDSRSYGKYGKYGKYGHYGRYGAYCRYGAYGHYAERKNPTESAVKKKELITCLRVRQGVERLFL